MFVLEWGVSVILDAGGRVSAPGQEKVDRRVNSEQYVGEEVIYIYILKYMCKDILLRPLHLYLLTHDLGSRDGRGRERLRVGEQVIYIHIYYNICVKILYINPFVYILDTLLSIYLLTPDHGSRDGGGRERLRVGEEVTYIYVLQYMCKYTLQREIALYLYILIHDHGARDGCSRERLCAWD